MLRTPSSTARGTAPTRTARPRSAAIRTGRRFTRSTQAPATGPNSRYGANWAAPSSPISAGVAAKRPIAVSGSATRVICEPTSETLWPTQSLRKSGCCQRAGRRSITASGPASGARRLAWGDVAGLELAQAGPHVRECLLQTILDPRQQHLGVLLGLVADGHRLALGLLLDLDCARLGRPDQGMLL